MVCDKCQKKLDKLAPPDKWRDTKDSKAESAGRKVNENKILSKAKRWQPYSAKCTVCKLSVAQNYQYCQKCAYAKGVCACCGKQILDTKNYKQSTA
eukprot:scaffold20.g7710.t1